MKCALFVTVASVLKLVYEILLLFYIFVTKLLQIQKQEKKINIFSLAFEFVI